MSRSKGDAVALHPMAATLTEKQLSDNIVALARMLGWLVHRDPTWRATGADPGYPDLTLIDAGGRIIFAELKAEGGRESIDQGRWRVRIQTQGCVDYYVWRPSDWYAGEVEAVLREEAGT